jgi:hypothetical protein
MIAKTSILGALGGAAVLALALSAGPQAPTPASVAGPVARWTFDDASGPVALDAAGGVKDEIRGRFLFAPGIASTGLKFDGYTTQVVRKARQAPRLADEFTVEAWVAPAALPWNWCPVLSQEANGLAGYSFGLGPLGEFGLKVSVRGEWVVCLSPVKLPLRKWAHIAATFRADDGIKLYLDGREVAARPLRGKAAYAGGADLLIGMNPDKRLPAFIVGQGSGTIPSWYSFDGLMDEISLYSRALPPEEMARLHAAAPAAAAPALVPRRLPSGSREPGDARNAGGPSAKGLGDARNAGGLGPRGPVRFGAYYTKLAYDESWDALWPAGPASDIVVQFDDSPIRVVFWRGLRYGPAWVMENGQWMTDQSFETWDGPEGCYEHMEDPHCLYSNVRILESTEARVVVHWRYAPVSSRNHRWRVEETVGWGLWVDEYYYFYPDQTAVRKMVWSADALGAGSPSQIQETTPLCEPGQNAEDILNPDAVTILNLQGESRTYSWPGEMDSPAKSQNLQPANPNIQVVNLKSKAKPFIIFEPGCRMSVYVGRVRKALADFSSYNHFPVSLLPSDGRFTVAPDKVASFSISTTAPPRHQEKDGTVWASWIYGVTDAPSPALAAIGRSWAKAPEMRLAGSAASAPAYDLSQRAYVLAAPAAGRPAALAGEFRASEDSPVENVALIVRNWGDGGAALSVDGKAVPRGSHFRFGHVRTLDGTDLIVWLKAKAVKPLSFVLTPR